MTQEEKSLLLKDLCARLPYGVICYWKIESELTEYNGQLTGINKVEITDSNDYYYDCYFNVCNDSNGGSFQNEDVPIEIVKPYLRPMSSMTEEEYNKYELTFDNVVVYCGHNNNNIHSEHRPTYETFDYLDSIHVDYRGLIPMGLALEAPEDMYNQ